MSCWQEELYLPSRPVSFGINYEVLDLLGHDTEEGNNTGLGFLETPPVIQVRRRCHLNGMSQEQSASIAGTDAHYGFKNISPRPLGRSLSTTLPSSSMSEPLALLSVIAGIISLSGTVLSTSISVRDTIDLLRARWKRKVKVSGLVAVQISVELATHPSLGIAA